ncbi:MAG: NAD-dependent epimerase/dehydratase family protein, partial [bacterium]
MKILIAGSSGLIGKPLVRFLKESGHSVAVMVRSHDLLNDSTALWDPQNDVIDIPKLDWIARDEGFGAVINLAGENLSSGR